MLFSCLKQSRKALMGVGRVQRLSVSRQVLSVQPALQMTRAGALISNLNLLNLNYIQLGLSDDLRTTLSLYLRGNGRRRRRRRKVGSII